jgi:voltage-gated potassium channel
MVATDSALERKQRRAELLQKFENATEWPLLLLALAMVPLLLLPVAVDVSHGTDTAIETILWMIWAVFALELTIRTYLAEHRLNYLWRHWYDVAIVAVPFLRPLRIARSARSMRVLRLTRVGPFIMRIWGSTYNVMRHRGLQFVLLIGLGLVLTSAALVLVFEAGNESSNIDDYGTALWWAMGPITTVGYGDTVPQTPEGKGLAVLLMLVGIAFFSWITANVAAFLVEFGGGDEAGVTTHDLMEKLEQLEAEIQELRRESRAATGEAPAGGERALED